MSIHRNSDELFDFKRMFTLLLGLVVLPTLLLSGFGILALKNERAALEKRLQDAYELRASRIEREILRRLPRQPGEEVSLERVNAALQSIVHELYPEEGARFTLAPNAPLETQDRSISEMLRNLSPGWPGASGTSPTEPPRPIVRHAMPTPFNDLTLSAYLTADPVGDTMVRNTIIYSSLMVLFLAAVIVGVFLTARYIHREARLSRLQTDFVSNISHELRTPLTSIRMFIETLEMGRVHDEAEVKECLSIIAAESERLTRMIERILGWARMEAGRRIYTFRVVPVSEVVQEALKAFRTQRVQASFQLTEEIDPDLPPVKVDVEAMAEALLNLLNNALKYTGDEKRITLRAYLHRGMVAIEVADNGIGISSHDRKRIFEKFYRADALLSRRTEGSGLGLTIVRHIIEVHGGRIQVESELGVGSRFTLLLPTAANAPRKLSG